MEFQASSATLSNGHSFAGKSKYDVDGFGAPPDSSVRSFASGIEDYGEIFGGSRASIPILDVPALKEPNVSLRARRSKLEYSKIFGGFSDSDFGVPHEELPAKPKKEQSFSDKARTRVETGSPLVGSEPPNFSEENHVFSHEASYQSSNGIKRFNMSYQKTNQGSKNGTNETMHIAQLHVVPGYTHIVDDISNLTEGMMEGNQCSKSVSSVPPGGARKQNSEGSLKFQNKPSWNRSVSNDKLFDAYEFGTHSSKVSSPSSSFNFGMASTVGVSRSDASESEAGVYSPPYLDEELDANSVAATSAAAVRKAIEEAQAKIRIAKELMERKKEGFQSRAKPSFKDGLRAGKRREEKIADESKRSKEEASKKNEKLDPPMQAFSGTGKQSMIKEREVTADFMDSEEHFTEDFMDSEECFTEDFMDSEERFTAEETIEEKYGHEFISTQVYHKPEKLEEWGGAKQLYETDKSGKNRAMTLDLEQGEDVNKIIQSTDEWKGIKTARKSFEKIVENDKKSKEAEEVCKRVEIEKKVDAIKGAQEWEECPIKITTAQEVHDWEDNGLKFEVTPEQNGTEKILEVSHEQEKREEKLQELQKPIRIEKKLEVQELEENFYMKMLKQAEWKNDEQEEAHEKAENENNRSKNICESEENEGRVKEICGQEDNGTKHKEAYEGVEYKEKKEQVDAHQGEDIEKSLDKVHVQEVMEEEISSEFLNREEGEKSLQEEVGSEEIGMLKGTETNVKIVEETCKCVETKRIQTEINQRTEHEKMKTIPEALKYKENDLEAADGVSKQDDNENETDTQESCRHTENDKDVEITPEVLALEENIRIGTGNKYSFGPKENENESEAIGVANDLQVTSIIDTAGSQGSLEQIEIEKLMKEAMEAHCFNKIGVDVLETDLYLGQKQNDQHEKASKIVGNLEQLVGDMARELEENYKIVEKAEVANNQEENKTDYESSHEESWIDNEEAGARELEENNKNVEEAEVANNQEENDNNYESSHEESWIDNDEAEARVLEENNKNAEEAEVVNNQEEIDNNYESSHKESWIDNEEAEARILGENNKNVREAEVANNQEENDNNYESSHKESWIDNEEAEVRELEENNKNVEEAEVANNQEENDNNYESSHEESWIDNEEAEARVLGENNKNVEEAEVANNQEENDNNYESSHEESWIDNEEAEVHELEENNKNVEGAEVANNQEENENYFESSHEESWIDNEKKLEAAQLPGMFEEKGKTVEMDWEVKTHQIAENSEENHYETLTMEKNETKDISEQEMELDEEHLKKINEAKEREREREKERIAVERAIREARERAFAEARERAAVERAAAEARRRVMAEANNKSSSERTSMEAKLKAERAAVERATAEARERALEKALSERAAFEARNQTEKFVVEKSSNSSRDYKMRQSFKSYDPQHNGSSSSSNSRYPNSSNHVSNSTEKNDGANGESAGRCKARSERHQRIAERAAKALAEKNKRDLLAQREQAEKNKLADALDADIKRWSSGKEKNLRALLSTLQYILGPDSGWKPIPLTDVVADTAVKKAYRKATLCVHPDKLQQRGATIQQKYICEKVFDLLKEAWNKFSAEER